MPLQDLGTINFLEAPTVNNDKVITTLNNSIPYFSSGLFSALPATGNAGRLYLTTDTQRIYRDNGTTWDVLMYGSAPIVRQFLYGVIAANTAATIIPQDNTSPLDTEGTLIWSQAFTPSYVGSKVNISMSPLVDCGTNNRMIIASIFRGSVNLGVGVATIVTNARPTPLSMNITDISPSTTPTTYTCRVGVSSAATWYINRNAAALYNGLLATNTYAIQEF
jgi:hypothetical protein